MNTPVQETQVPTGEAAAPAAAPKIEANGVVRPKDGTATGRIWAIADQLSAAAGAPVARKDVLDQAKAEGINESTAATQYGKWRVFNGLKGEPRKPAAPKPPKAKKEKKVKGEAAAPADGAAPAAAPSDNSVE